MEVAAARKERPLAALERQAYDQPLPWILKLPLRRGSLLNLIAELNTSLPFAGVIRADFNPGEQAQLYTSAGAAAISVLTDQRFFRKAGVPVSVRQVTPLPLLRKDFIVDPYQIMKPGLRVPTPSCSLWPPCRHRS
jgi:indole-3-glycerol phosphate synthase